VTTAGKAGLDLRGRARVQNVDVPEVNGVGGLWSSLGNFSITKSHRAGAGIANPAPPGVSIGNGTVVEPTGPAPP
jgi:hypothetical protein